MSVLDSFRLDGRRLFITGGSRGLGRQMALALGEAGADVVLTARTQESLDRTAADIRALGRKVTTITADMADAEACVAACEQALAEGPIDILINNVGGRREPTPVEAQSFEDWQRLLAFNTTSTFLCTKILGGAMIREKNGGRIINVASISAWKTLRGMGGRHYEAGKGAVLQFTRSVAADWAGHGINVNAICPGIFMTEANERWAKTSPDRIAGFLANVPAGRFGRPEEIGPLALFLASDASTYITGGTFVIDGGFDLW
ncbi:MAG TPA: SDR family NAD(P)-dependent oxidoreductase [Bauldia sp.]|nr:SDR family NAD(P)-dependent oxidoreductase [Bauldia sp.]